MTGPAAGTLLRCTVSLTAVFNGAGAMGTPVTIHGGQGNDTINFAFTVTGTNTTAYTLAFETAVNAILATNPTTPVQPAPDGILGSQAITSPVYVLEAPTNGNGPIPSYTLATAGYALDTISGAALITLDSVGGDTVLVAAINAEAYVVGNGGDNQVVFVTGQNVFNGSADTGGDTVVAGSGQDSIYTSLVGETTVYSGTGEATIVLQDTASSSGSFTYNDLVYLNDGVNTVFASGNADFVAVTAPGQTIYGYTSDAGTATPTSTLTVDLNNTATGGVANGDNLVNAAGSGYVFVFDSTSNNTIVGGQGYLNFISGESISAYVQAGTSGVDFLYGNAGDTITLSSSAGQNGVALFAAGAGNESLNGAGFANSLYLFGGNDSTAGNDTLIGGSGQNILTAGLGNETLQGGTGANFFQFVDSVSGGNITLTDFTANGSIGNVVLNGFSAGDEQSLLNDTVTVGGNLVATLGSTTITFTGITSGSQLQGHIYTFNQS